LFFFSRYSTDLEKTGHWNSWLLSQIASTFVMAFEELQLAALDEPLVTRTTKENAFVVIPPRPKKTGHFQSIFGEIREKLTRKKIFLAQGVKIVLLFASCDSDVSW
jgi:hypothetical protein